MTPGLSVLCIVPDIADVVESGELNWVLGLTAEGCQKYMLVSDFTGQVEPPANIGSFHVPLSPALPYFDDGLLIGTDDEVGRVALLPGDATLPGTITFYLPGDDPIGRIGNSVNALLIETMGGKPLFLTGGYFAVINEAFVSFNEAVNKSAAVYHDDAFAYFVARNNAGGHSGAKLLNDDLLGLTIASGTGIGTFSAGVTPASMADGAAANNTIYFSTTASKLVYKDAGGVVNALY